LDYEPLRAKLYFDFGTAWHAALAQWYEPSTWAAASIEHRTVWAQQAFDFSLNNQLQLYRDRGIDDMEMEREFEEAMTLGPAMFDNYIPYSLEHDDFTPIRVEQEFEVQIGWYVDSIVMYLGPHLDAWYEKLLPEPQAQAIPIVYQGRVDALVQDLLGNYWIAEWKSAEKAPPESNRWLAMDAQVGSYAWAIQKMLGIPIKGVIHRTTLKRAPEPPKLLKNNQLSIDRRQYTSATLFAQSVKQWEEMFGIPALDKYNEYLEFLASPDAPKFIYNEQVTRNPNQIANIGKWIAAEAQEMLSDPDIYPSPSSINCNSCAFYGPSLAWQEGSDWQFILDSQFVKRSETIEQQSTAVLE